MSVIILTDIIKTPVKTKIMSAEYTQIYAENLTKRLTALAIEKGYMDETFLDVEELSDLWTKLAPEYMVDAVPEISKYPVVSIAWACYFGLATASLWDLDWEKYEKIENLYDHIKSAKGFDHMDDYVTENIMIAGSNYAEKFDIEKREKLNSFIYEAANLVHTLIRKENIEPQSQHAFFVFAKTTEIFYKLGVSIALHILGYKYHKINTTSGQDNNVLN